jgi:hypothetical protein
MIVLDQMNSLHRQLAKLDPFYMERQGWETESCITALKSIYKDAPAPEIELTERQKDLVNESLAALAVELKGDPCSATKLAYARRALVDQLRLIPM